MSVPTAARRTHTAADGSPPARRPRPGLATIAGATLVALMAAAAVGRFVLVGRNAGSGPSRAGGAATPADRIATLEARVAVRPDDALAWQTLATAYVADAGATGDPARYEAARRAVERARSLAPDDARTLVASAVVALGVHDFAAAERDAERALALNPLDADALVAAVDAAVELGDDARATERLQTLLDVKPSGPALARASYVKELHGDLDGARTTMVRAEAATADPSERAVLATYAGDVALVAGDVDAAAAAYDRALALAPGRVGATLGRARVLLARGDLPGARRTAQDVLDRSPLPAAAALAADLADVAGDAAGAAAARQLVAANVQLQQAAGVAVDLEVALDAADHGDPATAVELARRAYDVRRTVFTADALGWALTRAGEVDEAIPYVFESLRLDTASPSLRVHAAAAYAAAGQTALASNELARAFALSPWPAFHMRAEAARLATSLGVALPPVWRP